MKRLIVNADDFGRSEGINHGIVEAHRSGIVTSATLMVAYPKAAEAARLALGCPRLGVGLHLALTGGTPVLPPARVPSLVDGQGRLPRKPEGLFAAAPADVMAEARAQLGRFEDLVGRPPTHVDSHHHAHRLPVVLEALAELAGAAGLPVRRASPAVAERLARARIPTSDFFDESFYGDGATLDGLLAVLDGLADGVTELMCHPARPDEELAAASGYARERERELAVLTSEPARRAIEERGVALIRFSDL